MQSEQYLSKEQFYKKCHISKATALLLIKSGLIPAEKVSGRYRIAENDVAVYLSDREKFPEKYGYTFKSYFHASEYGSRRTKRMQGIMKQDWIDRPDLLQTADVAEMLGYSVQTIRGWCIKGMLFSFRVSGCYRIPKTELLKFTCSRGFHRINPKSRIHIDYLRRATSER